MREGIPVMTDSHLVSWVRSKCTRSSSVPPSRNTLSPAPAPIYHALFKWPGVAYVQLDPQAPWPDNLRVKLPQ